MLQKFSHLKPQKLKAIPRYLFNGKKQRPLLVNLEVIKSCNATCHFCVCWNLEAGPRLKNYAPVMQKLKPVVVSVNGGEPLLRSDIVNIISQVRPLVPQVVMITNGGLLTQKKAFELFDAGLDLLTISVDYPDKRHDKVRGIPDLVEHITKLIPLIQKHPSAKLCFNSIIMNSNLDDVVPLAKMAYQLGVKISFSAYSSFKADNDTEMIPPNRLQKLEQVVNELLALKKSHGHITTSEYFFQHLVSYFRDQKIDDCAAGKKWVTVTPNGYVQPCSETERICHYTEWEEQIYPGTDCNVCWYACRAESQAPIDLKRVRGWF